MVFITLEVSYKMISYANTLDAAEVLIFLGYVNCVLLVDLD